MAKYFIHQMEILDTEQMNENPQYAFKGVWIPKEIWLAEDLTWMEKIFLAEINALDNDNGCYASNKFFSKLFRLSPSRCSEIINSLIKKQYLNASYIKENGQTKQRILHVAYRYIRDSRIGYSENTKGGYSENTKQSNIYIENIIRDIGDRNKVEAHSQNVPQAENLLSLRKDLTSFIKLTFLKLYGDFDKGSSYKKEGSHISKLVDRTIKACKPVTPIPDKNSKEYEEILERCKKYIKRIIDTFVKLHKSSAFWQKQPLLPSILNSQGIWPRVIEEMEAETHAPNEVVKGGMVIGTYEHGKFLPDPTLLPPEGRVELAEDWDIFERSPDAYYKLILKWKELKEAND